MSRINTNVQSLIARRVLGQQNQSLNRALEHLSTGLRINSGRDDPAGLIASESLRATKVGISAAISNAQRADSVVGVAEGSLREVNSLLLELEDLVDRSANEGGLSQDEVEANQLQIDSILQSIDRISSTTSFGDIKLLDGNFDFTTSGVSSASLTDVRINAAKVPAGGHRDVVIEVQASSQRAQLDYGAGALASNTTLQVRGNYGTETLSFVQGTATSAVAFAINGTTELTGVSSSANGANLTLKSADFGDDAFVSVSVLDGTMALTADGASATQDFGEDGTVIINGAQAIVNGLEASVHSGSLSMQITLDEAFAQQTTNSTSFQITGGGAVFAISPEVTLAGQETIGLASVSTASLGKGSVGFLSSLGSGQSNDLKSKDFATAQRVVHQAINQISSLRGRLGAFQKDTLTTTVNSLQVAFENVTAAESAIRDADFAAEASEMTRAQILVNSSMLTLQTANQQPASVLQLLG